MYTEQEQRWIVKGQELFKATKDKVGGSHNRVPLERSWYPKEEHSFCETFRQYGAYCGPISVLMFNLYDMAIYETHPGLVQDYK